jgi:hypothetical protein
LRFLVERAFQIDEVIVHSACIDDLEQTVYASGIVLAARAKAMPWRPRSALAGAGGVLQ